MKKVVSVQRHVSLPMAALGGFLLLSRPGRGLEEDSTESLIDVFWSSKGKMEPVIRKFKGKSLWLVWVVCDKGKKGG